MKKYPIEMLVHPSEKVLFMAGAVVSSVVWLIVLFITLGFGAAAVVIGLLIGLCVKYTFVARVKGFGVRVSEHQYPRVYAKAKAIADELSLAKVPEIYVYNMNGLLNAFAMKVVSRNFVIITTDLLKATGGDEDLIGFTLAHEIAHHHRKHLQYQFFLLPVALSPWIGKGYSRACEYTCDAYGAQFGASSLEKARAAVALLATADHKSSLDLHAEEYIYQARDVSEFWATVANINSTHPFTSLRYLRIQSLFSDIPLKMPKYNIWGKIMAPVLSPVALFILVYAFLVIVLATMDQMKKDDPTKVDNASEIMDTPAPSVPLN
jgi:Zn-dependent protease with chaperone function